MENKEIRFIDSKYNELFRIPDGNEITIQYPDGHTENRTCRYIDDYHFYANDVCFHICQFAELMEQKNRTYTPRTDGLANKNRFFIFENSKEIDKDKFFIGEDSITEVYYNPDATSGGQFVYNEISFDQIKHAARASKDTRGFFAQFDSRSTQYLIDIDTPEFGVNLESFINRKADFEERNLDTVKGIKKAAGITPHKRHRENFER